MANKLILQTDIIEFDLDGTLVNTTVAVEKTWRDLCKQHNVNADDLFEHSHGSRTSDVFARFFPNIDNTDNKAAIEFERTIVETFPDDVVVIPGARELLQSLNPHKWCIVTSGNKGIATGWFKEGKVFHDIPKPDVFIVADMVTKGKPHPEGFLRGAEILAESLNLDKSKIKKLVYEDSIAGINAGLASGATVIGVASGFTPKRLYEAGAHYVIQDMKSVKVLDGDKIELELKVIGKE
ncbi:hypothetical protein WICMUC_005077 [Wickerhamomyces mucosus]|uniref:Uncharacterized protein n=1 Tax=Wickerhamomyces mucosus TaxID=1378264 RepID=A0A9P8PBA8_9ASCO|nr:hypothetical protein WICMUC_005077 [Wickerhamomyces mucosus]